MLHPRLYFFICTTLIYTSFGYCQTSVNIDSLRINQLQIIGSHNSYHLRANKPVLNFLKGLSGILPKEYDPHELDYEHEPLQLQLDSFHLRSFEIDIYPDPDGGQFYYRKKNNLLGKPKASGIAALKEPGFKVMHIPDIDYNTRYFTFKSMLADLKKWSDAHPDHLPIFILIEGKEESIASTLKKMHFTKTIPFTPALSNDIDKEIKDIFGDHPDKIITPDMVRGNFATLREAVAANNWPSIAAARGKFIFITMEKADKPYLIGHPNLEGRLMFTFSKEGNPEAAFIKFDDPIENQKEIKTAVQKGYIIRTRADNPNKQNRSGDYLQMMKAFESGAQIISSDYYRPDPRYKTKPKKFKNYFCRFPHNDIGIINPVTAPVIKIKER